MASAETVQLRQPPDQVEQEQLLDRTITGDFLQFLNDNFWGGNQFRPEGWENAKQCADELLHNIVRTFGDTDENSEGETSLYATGSVPLAIATGGFSPKHWNIPLHNRSLLERSRKTQMHQLDHQFLEKLSDDAPADVDFVLVGNENGLLDKLVQLVISDKQTNIQDAQFTDVFGFEHIGKVSSYAHIVNGTEVLVTVYDGPVKTAPEVRAVSIAIHVPVQVLDKTEYHRIVRYDLHQTAQIASDAIPEKRLSGLTFYTQDRVYARLGIAKNAVNHDYVRFSMTQLAIEQARLYRNVIDPTGMSFGTLLELVLRSVRKDLSRTAISYPPEVLYPYMTLASLFRVRKQIQRLVLLDNVWIDPAILELVKAEIYICSLMGLEMAQTLWDTMIGAVTITRGMTMAEWIACMKSPMFAEVHGATIPSVEQRTPEYLEQVRNNYREGPNRMDGFNAMIQAFLEARTQTRGGQTLRLYQQMWGRMQTKPPIDAWLNRHSEKPPAQMHPVASTTYRMPDGTLLSISTNRSDPVDPGTLLQFLDHVSYQFGGDFWDRNPSKIHETIQMVTETYRGSFAERLREFEHRSLSLVANAHFEDLLNVYALMILFPDGLTAQELSEWYNEINQGKTGYLEFESVLLLLKLIGVCTYTTRYGIRDDGSVKPIRFFAPSRLGERTKPLVQLLRSTDFNQWQLHFNTLFSEGVSAGKFNKLRYTRDRQPSELLNLLMSLSTFGITNIEALDSLVPDEDFEVHQTFFENYQYIFSEYGGPDQFYQLVEIMQEALRRSSVK